MSLAPASCARARLESRCDLSQTARVCQTLKVGLRPPPSPRRVGPCRSGFRMQEIAATPQRRLRAPQLRALQTHDGGRQRRVRHENPALAERSKSETESRSWEPCDAVAVDLLGAKLFAATVFDLRVHALFAQWVTERFQARHRKHPVVEKCEMRRCLPASRFRRMRWNIVEQSIAIVSSELGQGSACDFWPKIDRRSNREEHSAASRSVPFRSVDQTSACRR